MRWSMPTVTILERKTWWLCDDRVITDENFASYGLQSNPDNDWSSSLITHSTPIHHTIMLTWALSEQSERLSVLERYKALLFVVFQAFKDFMARQKIGRLCTAEEVAHLCVYLASDEVSPENFYSSD